MAHLFCYYGCCKAYLFLQEDLMIVLKTHPANMVKSL